MITTQTHSLDILLADDGSQHSRAAINFLCDLPLSSDSNIHILSVFTPLMSSEHETVRQNLEQSRVCLIEKGYHIDANMTLGYPAEKIIEYAENLKPDLIVVGAKGLRATLGILLGGVAQQVVEYADWPVLVVRAPYHGLKRVMLAADGSTHSESAARYISSFPFPTGAMIDVIHVLPPVAMTKIYPQSWPEGPGLPYIPQPEILENMEKIQAAEEAEGERILDRIQDVLKSANIQQQRIMRRGDAATEMIEHISENNIDLVVVGSRGLSPVRSWLLGSVSRKLIHYSGCSVLVVKAKEE